MKQASVEERIETGRAAMAKASSKHRRPEKPLPPHQQIGEGVYRVQSGTRFGVTYTCDLNEGRCDCDGYAWNLIKGGGKPCFHLRLLLEKYGMPSEPESELEWPDVARQNSDRREGRTMPIELLSTDDETYQHGLDKLFEEGEKVEPKTYTFVTVDVRGKAERRRAA